MAHVARRVTHRMTLFLPLAYVYLHAHTRIVQDVETHG
jgi:hypothetical protein